MSVILERIKQGPGAAYHFVSDRLAKAPADDAAGIPKGQGALVENDGRKLAVYRDDEGELHAMSPVCRHLRCIVDWNDADKTWSCPCHGSKYDPLGKVVHGPAKEDLLPESLR